MNAAAPWVAIAAGLDKTGRQAPLPVILAIDPWNQGLENAALRLFRTSPRLRVYTHAEVAAALPHDGAEQAEDALAKLGTGPIPPEMKEALLKRLGPAELTRLLVVRIRRADVADDVYRYTADAILLGGDGDDGPREPF